MRIHRALGLLPAAALAAAFAAPARAADPPPLPACAGYAFEDPIGDQANTAVPAGDRTPSTDIANGFLLYDPATQTTTYNITVANLTDAVPATYTQQSWTGYFVTPDGITNFVRATRDLTGAVIYEYGAPDNSLMVVSRSAVTGTTTGRLFGGANGVIQIDIPKTLAVPGTTLAGLYAQTAQSRTSAPTAVPSLVTRGLTFILDTSPDGAPDGADATFSVTPCP
jgi:hypothetical protein